MKKLTIILSFFISCSTAANCQQVQMDSKGNYFAVRAANDTTKAKEICPKCREVDCIYMEINENVKGSGTDTDIYNSVIEVCRKRNIKDSSTIELLLKEYYL